MNIVGKSLIGILTAGTMVLSAGAPAFAHDAHGTHGRYVQDNARTAALQCMRAAERTADRYSRGDAKVTDIRNVERARGGYMVKGRIEMRNAKPARYAASDSGRFTCEVRHGRIVDLDFHGIRRL